MKICIVKLSAMGDIIHAMAGLQFIKKEYPKARIDWIVESSFQGVLDGNKDIDNILPINLKKIKTKKSEIFNQIKILKGYAKNNYDLVIDAQGLLKSAIVAKIVGKKVVNSYICGFDKSSIREGIASYFYDETVKISYSANVITRNLKVLCEPMGIKITDDDIKNKNAFLFYSQNNEVENMVFTDYIVLVVGASKINKVLPKETFLNLINKLNQKTIVVWGNDEEYAVAKYLSTQSKLITLCDKVNLNGLKNIIANSKLVIGGDTGPTHMAWGMNVPSVTIFGNTPGSRNTYITNINKVVESKSEVDCNNLDKNDFSINEIKVDDILEVVDIIQSHIEGKK